MSELKYDSVISALPTPFYDDGRIDLDSLRRVIDLFLGGGVGAVTVLGVSGEGSRMTESERLIVLDACIAHVDGRVPVVLGATTEGVHSCIEWCIRGQKAGAAGVLVSPPRAVKLNSDSVVNHFRRLGEEVNIPIIVQDYPPETGFFMEPELLVRIATEVPSVQALKLEDAPTPLKIARIRGRAGGQKLSVLGGLGGLYLLEELMSGGTGAMTGFSYPEMLLEVVRSFNAGTLADSADMFYRYVPIIRFGFQRGIDTAIRKEMLRRRGALSTATVRPPGPGIDRETSASLDCLLDSMRRQGVSWV